MCGSARIVGCLQLKSCLCVQIYGKLAMLPLLEGDPLHLPHLVELLLSAAIVFLDAHGILLPHNFAL